VRIGSNRKTEVEEQKAESRIRSTGYQQGELRDVKARYVHGKDERGAAHVLRGEFGLGGQRGEHHPERLPLLDALHRVDCDEEGGES